MTNKSQITKAQIDELNTEVIKEFGRDTQLDGVLNLDVFNETNPRILWILKEPNWGEDYNDIEENKEHLNDDEIRNILENQLTNDYRIKYYNDVTVYNKWKMTFQNIFYITYGILERRYNRHEIPNIDDKAKINGTYRLSEIAFINLKKIPGGSNANPNKIESSYFKHKEFIHKQIKIIDPNIIINASRVHSLFNDLSEGKSINMNYSFPFVVTESRLIIDTFHPLQKEISAEDYVDSILCIVKD